MTQRILPLVLAILTLALLAAPALAAEEETGTIELNPTGPGGITTLVFLMGVAGILIVGGVIIARDNFRPENDTED